MAIIGGWRIKYLKAKNKKTKKTKRKRMACYEKRKDTLSELGYASYKEYLLSDEWRKVREDKLRRYPQCFLCPKKACQVHHTSYETRVLLGLDRYRLVTLCDSCHEGIEFEDNGTKRTLGQANAVLELRAARAGHHAWLQNLRDRKPIEEKNRKREELAVSKREAGNKHQRRPRQVDVCCVHCHKHQWADRWSLSQDRQLPCVCCGRALRLAKKPTKKRVFCAVCKKNPAGKRSTICRKCKRESPSGGLTP